MTRQAVFFCGWQATTTYGVGVMSRHGRPLLTSHVGVMVGVADAGGVRGGYGVRVGVSLGVAVGGGVSVGGTGVSLGGRGVSLGNRVAVGVGVKVGVNVGGRRVALAEGVALAVTVGNAVGEAVADGTAVNGAVDVLSATSLVTVGAGAVRVATRWVGVALGWAVATTLGDVGLTAINAALSRTASWIISGFTGASGRLFEPHGP